MPKFSLSVQFTVCNLCDRSLPVKKIGGQNINFSSRYTQNGVCVSEQIFTYFEATLDTRCVFGRALSTRKSYLKLIILCLRVISFVLNNLEKYFAVLIARLRFMTSPKSLMWFFMILSEVYLGSRKVTSVYFFQVVLVFAAATWQSFIAISFLDPEIWLCRNHS